MMRADWSKGAIETIRREKSQERGHARGKGEVGGRCKIYRREGIGGVETVDAREGRRGIRSDQVGPLRCLTEKRRRRNGSMTTFEGLWGSEISLRAKGKEKE